jgi:hypothetical protein
MFGDAFCVDHGIFQIGANADDERVMIEFHICSPRLSSYKHQLATCRERPAINRYKSAPVNPVLCCESPIDRALCRSPQIYLQALSAEQGDVFNY